MFRDYLEKGKVWVDKIASAVMNYSELEIKVREATNDEPWGPHGKILNDLARETHNAEGLLEIMMMLVNRIFPDNPNNWRRTYKGLIVLAYLLRNGSDRVYDIARDNFYNIRSLENYECIDERGRDQGASVRIKAHEVVELLQDPEFLQSERQKALSSQKSYDGIGSNKFLSGNNYSRNFSGYDDDEDDSFRYPTCTAPKSEMPWNSRDGCDSSSSYRNPTSPSNKLGSFESWKGAHERTFVDEVADKLSEVCRAAKVVTNDLLGKPRVPPPSVYEDDPHKVSEDTLCFPDANLDEAEEEGEGFSSFRQAPLPPPSTTTKSKNTPSKLATSEILPSPLAPIPLIDLDEPTNKHGFENPSRLPRPPSIENLATTPKNAQGAENVDFFAELDKQHSKPAASSADLFANFNATFPAPVSSSPSGSPVVSVTSNLPDNADFGDFSSFKTLPEGAKPITSNGKHINTSDDPFFSAFSSPSTTQTPSTSTMPFATSVTMSVQQTSNEMPIPAFENSKIESKAPLNVGKTWSDLGTINIDLDLKASNNTNIQKPASPSLSQLRSQKQNLLFSQPMQQTKTIPDSAVGGTAGSNSATEHDFADFASFK
nr:clathrin interactor 1 [Hymenolepis microstoma]